MACVALAWLRQPLPFSLDFTKANPTASLTACGVLAYWANRNDLAKEEKDYNTEPVWQMLIEKNSSTALSVMREYEQTLKFDFENMNETSLKARSLLTEFPDNALSICRNSRPVRDPRYICDMRLYWSPCCGDGCTGFLLFLGVLLTCFRVFQARVSCVTPIGATA